MKKAFIFDLDGTLVDTSESIACCLKKLAAAKKCPRIKITEDEMNKTLHEMMKDLFPNENLSEISEEFLTMYSSDPLTHTYLYQGIEEFLLLLRREERLLFVVTTKPAVSTQKLIEAYFPNTFKDIICPDVHKGRNQTKGEMIHCLLNKYRLTPDQVMFIGDRYSDYAAARINKIDFAFMTDGYESKEKKELLKRKALLSFKDYNEMIKHLDL